MVDLSSDIMEFKKILDWQWALICRIGLFECLKSPWFLRIPKPSRSSCHVTLYKLISIDFDDVHMHFFSSYNSTRYVLCSLWSDEGRTLPHPARGCPLLPFKNWAAWMKTLWVYFPVKALQLEKGRDTTFDPCLFCRVHACNKIKG